MNRSSGPRVACRMRSREHVVTVLSCLSALTGLAPGCGFNRDDGWLAEDVVTLADAPPAIHGGTLLVLADRARVMVGDPDRDRVVLVELETGTTRELPLARPPSGSHLELGRMIEDGSGRVHALARRGGFVIEIDPDTMTEIARREVCDAPRGLAYEAEGDRLHVACADGTLVTLGPSRALDRRVYVGGDLRDVSVVDGALLLSRFRSAETVRVLADGTVGEPRTLPPSQLSSPASPELEQTYEANTAVRLVGLPSGALVLHQRARVGPESVVRAPASTYSYSSRPTSDGFVTWQDPCDNAVAHVSVSVLSADGAALAAGMPLRRGVTPVDLAVSSSGRVAVALAGDPGGRYSAGPQVISAVVGDVMRSPRSRTECLPGEERRRFPGQVVSVAFASETMIVQTREPSTLVIGEGDRSHVIALGGEPVADTGHQLFHMDLGGTIACATCHPGGGDDGHVWTFMATGSIRTQTLEGVVGLPPYHRAGNVPSFEALLRGLEPQMDAPPLDDARTDALERWLAAMPATPRGISATPELVAEGEALFAREACASCHAGELGTDRQLHEIATGTALTPPLAGIAARAPYLTDGRALDLEDALDRHAVEVTERERDALVAYLETR
ncbi:MAG: c-type cytochrome [Deltaproteobacteria bacterium]|nr:c-type cytochrome [Deltaproteobacteria bacterium]